MTLFHRESPLTFIVNAMEIPITERQWLDHQRSGQTVQASFPELTPDQREFLISGYTTEDWAAIFKDDHAEFDREVVEDIPAF